MVKEFIALEIVQRKIKRKNICKDVGITNSQLSNFIRGKKSLSIKNIEKLMEYLDIYLTRPNRYDEDYFKNKYLNNGNIKQTN